jgi:hypothetical protein
MRANGTGLRRSALAMGWKGGERMNLLGLIMLAILILFVIEVAGGIVSTILRPSAELL